MIGSVVGLWVALASTFAVESISKDAPPRALDSRLLFERIAAEPEIVTPTGIAVDSRGRVLVIESHTHFRPAGYAGPPADRIRVFEDRDHDGKPECVGTFFEGTRMTMNLKVAGDGSVFVATRSALYHLWDRDGDGRADGVTSGTLPTPFVRLDTRGDYPHNGLSGFAFDFTGNVYFGLGENLGATYRLIGSDGVTLTGGGEGGNIYRCRPDGSKLERVATGFWNPFHMTFDAFGRLFAVDNDPDSRPPCRLLHIVQGGDYGYRFRNGRKGVHPFTAWNGELPGTLGMVAGTGEAPSGVVEYDRDNLPEDYRGSLLVTSWGDHRIEQYRLEPRGATFRATMKPVVAGGEDFRPVGIAVAPDGSLYISDWVDKSYDVHGKGRIWRLRYAGATSANALPGRDGSAPTQHTARSTAIALAAAAAAGKFDKDLAAASLRSEFADVRSLAVSNLPAPLVELKDVAASDPSPLVRATAMRRLTDPGAKEVLLKALESDDPFLLQAARVGLRQSLQPNEILASAGSKALSPAQRLGLLLILRDADRPEARAVLPAFLSDPDPNIRFAAIQWVGEHRLTEFRSRLQAALTSSAETRGLFEATLAAIEMLDGKARGPLGEVAGEDYIVALLKDPRTPAPVLQHALRMVRPDHPALTLSFFRRLLTNADETVRIEALRSLCQSSLRNRFETLGKLAEDPSASVPLRAEAIAGLADDAAAERERLLALATAEQPVLRHESLRGLRGIQLTDDQRSKLRTSNRGDPKALELLDFLTSGGAATGPQAHRSDPPATDLDAWLARLDGPADAAAGERVFFHTKGPGCYRCHQVDGRGSRAGPDLTNLAAGVDRRRLVESIVAPGKEIAPQFVTYTVARTDGTIFDGILLEQSPEGELVFADSKGRRIVVKTGDIAERKPQTISIMPADLPRTMTTQEMRDLLAFLREKDKSVHPMKCIPRDLARKFAFDWRDEPLLRVEPGESFEVETFDASNGYIKTAEDKAIPAHRPGFDRIPPQANPIAGPIWVEGARRGDTLVVAIEEILVDDYSWIAIGPRRGPLGESTRWPELSSEYTTKIFRHTPGPSGTTRDGTLHFDDRRSWPITPFIGTLGVAPDREVTTSIDGQGEWGGNLDIRDVAPGNRVSLPIFHEGALFYLGDVHASQGDTEFTGTAAETKARVRLRFELVKDKRIPGMRIEKPGSLVAIHAEKPLDQAVETATINLMDWLISEHGFSPIDAYCLVSTCPDFRINVYQMCRIRNLRPVAGAEIPKAYLLA